MTADQKSKLDFLISPLSQGKNKNWTAAVLAVISTEYLQQKINTNPLLCDNSTSYKSKSNKHKLKISHNKQ